MSADDDHRDGGGSGDGALKPLAAGLSLAAVFVAVVSIPLDAASELGLSGEQTTAWIMVVWGLPSLLTIALIIRYRQPILLTGNIFILIFVFLLGGELSWPELVGATMAAGSIVLVLGLTGLTRRLASVLPAPIVHGLLAGAVLDLVADSFTALGTSTLLAGSTFLAYFATRAWSGGRVPALLPALLVGTAVAMLGGETGSLPDPVWPSVALTPPAFSMEALITATPILVVFITLQANAPSIVFLRDHGYDPPERLVSVLSGAGTLFGSIFGPFGVSLSLPATALTAGRDAGAHESRHRAGLLAAGVALLIAIMAGFATDLIEFVPGALLDVVVGLAVLGILARSLAEIIESPLRLGPLVAFAVSVSDIRLLDLGRFFWALVLGLTVSLLVDRRGSAEDETLNREAEPGRSG